MTTISAALPHARRRRYLFWTVVNLLLASLLLPSLYSFLAADRELREAQAEADRMDPNGWHINDLEAQRAMIPDEQNSGQLLVRLAALLPAAWPSWDYPDAPQHANHDHDELLRAAPRLDLRAPFERFNAVQMKVIHEELQRAAPVLTGLRQIDQRPRGRYPATYRRDIINPPLPHTENTRLFVSMLTWDALGRADDQDFAGALRACRETVYCRRAIGDEPTLSSSLIRIALGVRALNILERVLAQGQPAEADLAATQALLQEELNEQMFLIGARGERAAGDAFMQALQDGDIKFTQLPTILTARARSGLASLEDLQLLLPGSLRGNRAALLRLHNRCVEIARLPAEKRTPGIKSLAQQIPRLPYLARALAWAMQRLAYASQIYEAKLRCAITLLAIERFRQARGRWPTTLAELVPQFLPALPVDPFDGEPLRYGQFPDGVVVYSVSYDLTDDGGNLNDNILMQATDLGYHLWDVPRRRQPPRESSESIGK
jgi:hypothetical protein